MSSNRLHQINQFKSSDRVQDFVREGQILSTPSPSLLFVHFFTDFLVFFLFIYFLPCFLPSDLGVLLRPKNLRVSSCRPSIEKKTCIPKFLLDLQKYQRSFQYFFQILLQNTDYI